LTPCDRCQLDYWPDPHCPDCHRTWYGLEECHCASCHEHFSSDTVFLAHQTEDACRDPGRLAKTDGTALLKQVERKGGPVWVTNDHRVHPQKALRDRGARLGGDVTPTPATTTRATP
jgi:hypothetical protein